uniref:Uncharacterized protein n=1 Tax=Arundo donax TaxID=35708 RepID=A0A0A8ZNV0_ARUDO
MSNGQENLLRVPLDEHKHATAVPFGKTERKKVRNSLSDEFKFQCY